MINRKALDLIFGNLPLSSVENVVISYVQFSYYICHVQDQLAVLFVVFRILFFHSSVFNFFNVDVTRQVHRQMEDQGQVK